MMPAGKYYVGDLCYVMHDEWSTVCNLFFHDRTDGGCNEGEFVLDDGRRFASLNTAWGDGTYCSNGFGEFSVDAGLIGCIRIEDIRDPSYSDEKANSFGTIVTFGEDFEVYSENGTLFFGDIAIETNPNDEDYYEEEYEEESGWV